MEISPLLVLIFGCLYCTSNVFCVSSYLRQFQRSVGDVVSSWIFQEKCMGELGCFNNGAPFFDIVERPLSLLPSDRESINTHFLLYTRANPNHPQNFTNLHRDPQAILRSAFLSESRIKFIIPGYLSSWAPDWEDPLKDALLADENVNVFLVNWSGGDGLLYEQAVSNTRVVGAELAVFIEYLQNTTGVEPEDVHIIGHSLGAHIAGYAGKIIKSIGRISGLDPAGPYFESVDSQVRLAHTDAFFVDVIHTNAAGSRWQGFGTTESIGDLDFFPNGGSLQPGCPDLGHAIWSFLKHPSLKGESMFEIMCNHHRAIELYISTITEKNCNLLGIRCGTWKEFEERKCGSCYESPQNCFVMGYHADESWRQTGHQRANLYLNTTASPPFCEHA